MEALLATVVTAGDKSVDRSDAAAIQAAEVRATGQTNIMPGGLAATAQSAAQINAKPTTTKKTTLADVLSVMFLTLYIAPLVVVIKGWKTYTVFTTC